jgi:hypothetical protein
LLFTAMVSRMKTSILRLAISGLLAGVPLTGIAQDAPAGRLPGEVALSDVEMGLELQRGGGGCVVRCMSYRILIQGTGRVDFDDLGGEPRLLHQQRIIAREQAISLLNDFLSARFFERPPSYYGLQFAERNGDSVRILQHGAADYPTWILSLRLGQQRKDVRLLLDEPPELKQLRDRIADIGGPDAWKQK